MVQESLCIIYVHINLYKTVHTWTTGRVVRSSSASTNLLDVGTLSMTPSLRPRQSSCANLRSRITSIEPTVYQLNSIHTFTIAYWTLLHTELYYILNYYILYYYILNYITHWTLLHPELLHTELLYTELLHTELHSELIHLNFVRKNWQEFQGTKWVWKKGISRDKMGLKKRNFKGQNRFERKEFQGTKWVWKKGISRDKMGLNKRHMAWKIDNCQSSSELTLDIVQKNKNWKDIIIFMHLNSD